MKSISSFLECYTDIFTVLNNNTKLNESELIRAIRLCISDEYDAIKRYTQLAESINNKKVSDILTNISNEEKVHVGEFLKILKELSPDEDFYYNKGMTEN